MLPTSKSSTSSTATSSCSKKSKLQSVHGNENDLNNAMVFICLYFSHQEAIVYFINKTYNVASLLLLPQWTFEVLIALVGLKYFVGRRHSTIGDRWLSVGDDQFMFRVLGKELKSLNLECAGLGHRTDY